MTRILAVVVACGALGGVATPQQPRAAALRAGVLLYAMPGLHDPNFARTVVLLIEHGNDGSVGVVLNQPTARRVDDALDLRAGRGGVDLNLFWGGPVQPEAVLSLIRTRWRGPRTRTIAGDIQLTRDLADVKQVLDEPGGRLRVRMFAGYAGWGRGQLAAEVGAGSWVVAPADAATVFSPEPSRMWEKVREILRRLQA
jgi:putative transcriptional regulator